jgi:carbon monoxide dehydrogenase subunit G
VKLEFSGAPEITARRERVWQRLVDPHFIARSAPAVQSVEVIDLNHFKVMSAFGVGGMKARLTMDGELLDLVPGSTAKMRLRGRGAGSVIEVLSSIALREAGSGKVRLHWSATTELSGMVTRVGARLIENIARQLTEQFWADFARRVTEESGQPAAS